MSGLQGAPTVGENCSCVVTAVGYLRDQENTPWGYLDGGIYSRKKEPHSLGFDGVGNEIQFFFKF